MPIHDPVPRRTPPPPRPTLPIPGGLPADPLADPSYAPRAWGRFRRILIWMTLVSVLAGGGAVAILWHLVGPLPIHMGVATFLGVGCTILMAAALMGLIFLSSGSGHDEAVDRFEPDA